MTTNAKPHMLKPLQSSASGSKLVGRKKSKDIKDSKEGPSKTSKSSLTSLFSRKTSTSENDLKKAFRDVAVGVKIETAESADNTEVSISITSRPDTAADIRDMLLGAEPDKRYWELLAEERRRALDEALQENLALSIEMAKLKETNRQLQFLADEGKRYAEILKEALEQQDEDENSSN